MEFTNLNKALKTYSEQILKSYVTRIIKNTNNKNHDYAAYPKRLKDSASFKIKELENFIGIYFEANKYWIFIEKGVKRKSKLDVDRIPTKLSDATWQLKPRPFLSNSIKEVSNKTEIQASLETALAKDIKESLKEKLNTKQK